MLLVVQDAADQQQQQQSLEAVLAQLKEQLNNTSTSSSSKSSDSIDCITGTGLELQRGPVAGTDGVMVLGYSSSRDSSAAEAAAAAAAEQAAALNADAGNGAKYGQVSLGLCRIKPDQEEL